MVNSPYSPGSMCSRELQPWKVQPRLLHPSPVKFPFCLFYIVDRRVPQGQDLISVHPSILSLTIAISWYLRTERRKQGRKQGSYRALTLLTPHSSLQQSLLRINTLHRVAASKWCHSVNLDQIKNGPSHKVPKTGQEAPPCLLRPYLSGFQESFA